MTTGSKCRSASSGQLRSRRQMFALSWAAIAPMAISRPARAQSKMSKDQAGYQPEPENDQRCSGCVHFQPDEGACRLVEGDISPDGWCRLWTAKP